MKLIETRPKHPSGRPIQNRPYKPARSIHREPMREPLTPGLRRNGYVQAIGFHVDYATNEDGD